MANTAIGQFLDFINSKKPTKKQVVEKVESVKKSAETIQIGMPLMGICGMESGHGILLNTLRWGTTGRLKEQ